MEAARAAEAEGRRIVHMEVGQPSTAAPLKARQAVAAALPHDAMGYTVALGLPELRAGIAALYKRWYDVDLDPARVVCHLWLIGRVSPRFHRIVRSRRARPRWAAPGYPSYRQILKALALTPVDIPHPCQPRPSIAGR